MCQLHVQLSQTGGAALRDKRIRLNSVSMKHFCTLAYRPSEQARDARGTDGKVVLLAVKSGNGGLDFRVSPEIWNVVQTDDLQYINDLLMDVSERARRYPEALFRQLATLSARPLVTHKVGVSGVDDQYLLEVCAEFVDLNQVAVAARTPSGATERENGPTVTWQVLPPHFDARSEEPKFPGIDVVNDPLFALIPFPMDIVDSSGRILYMNSLMERAMGKRAEGDRCWAAYRDDRQQCAGCPLNETIEIGKIDVMESGGVGGRTYEIHHTGMMYRGQPALLEIFLDITDRKYAEERQRITEASIWRQANYDSLTELPNRSLFHDRLEHEIKMLRRDEESLALFFLDFDNFKRVNDSLGHRLGDKLLIEAAKRISTCVRAGDTVARLGGDEFTIIVPALTNRIHIERIAAAIQSEISRQFVLEGYTVQITTSIGIALYPADAKNSEDLISNADQAMYRAKGLGGNRYAYASASSQKKVVPRGGRRPARGAKGKSFFARKSKKTSV